MIGEWKKDLEQILDAVCKVNCSCARKCSKKLNANYAWELLEEFLENRFHLQRDYAGSNAIREGSVVSGKLSSRIYAGENSRIKGPSRIEGPVYVGKNSVINPFSHIRGPVVIGDNCIVGGEIKNSIILHNSKLPHANYVGDSVIGRDCSLGAGVVLANLRADKKDVSVEYNNRRYNTGRRKFGSVLEDRVFVGCNAVLNPGAYLNNGVVIKPCSSVKGQKY